MRKCTSLVQSWRGVGGGGRAQSKETGDCKASMGAECVMIFTGKLQRPTALHLWADPAAVKGLIQQNIAVVFFKFIN